MNKNKIVITLIVAALFAPMFTQAQDTERKGPPNSVREQRTEGNNRKSLRGPSSGSNNERGDRRGGRKPQAGTTTRTEGGGSHNPLGEMKKALNLSDMQADWFRTVHEKWHKAARAIHSDKELSEEQKKAKLKEAFKKMDAVIRRLLNKEQYAKLVKIRSDRARPRGNNRK